MLNLDYYELMDLTHLHKKVIFDWRNAERIRKYMILDHKITWAEHNDWFGRTLTRPKHQIAKVLHYHGQPIGFVNFSDIDPVHRRCTWGLYIGEKDAPKGAGTILGFLSLNFMFDEINIRKLCGQILDFNLKSVYFHQKLGFIQEGLLKEHVYRAGRYVDVLLMALFKKDWILKGAHL